MALLLITIKKGLIKGYLNSILGVLRSFSKTLHKRKRIQSIRRIEDKELFSSPAMVFPPGIVKGYLEEKSKLLLDKLLNSWWLIVKPML
jgi:hypothetical protein